ncbi:MAG TPA: DUF58 domain-containing protein [Prolixibacteraceae bacterium]|nr:DUF58 domain-containing protein [Prolixibacteraceae bacterium]
MINFIKDIYTRSRLYAISSFIVLLFILGHFFDPLYPVSRFLLLVFVLILMVDAILLFFSGRKLVLLHRVLPEKLSNGDENKICIYIKNNHFFNLHVDIIDEIPIQFQIRDFTVSVDLKPGQEQTVQYVLTPRERGEYIFGFTNVYVSTPFGCWCRRIKSGASTTKVAVYPSFLQMRKYEFLAISDQLTDAGIKRIRRIGSYAEFDQIKAYVAGDNYRTINWNATARRSKLMVNQYQEERAQQVISVIDKGRLMQMPFNGMSLLDYAINSSLVLSNAALLKYDKAGLITFNQKVDTWFKAERANKTIPKILELLYNQKTGYLESDYAYLSAFIRRNVSHRSLVILYTNFETITSLHRQIDYFKHLAKNHLLLVVIFENAELKAFARNKGHDMKDLYVKTIAEKFVYEKKLIVRELKKHGILSILTKPEDLSTNLINKYLEIKMMGKL